MIKAFKNVSNDSKFIELYKQSFALKEENKIQLFKKKIKLNRISQVKDVIYHSDNELFSMRKKLKWKHGGCVFCEKFNKLLNDQNYECPTYGQKL